MSAWEWSVATLPTPSVFGLIGAAEAKGVRLVALHAGGGQAVVGLCSPLRVCKVLEPLCSSLHMFATEEEAQLALRAESGGFASLYPAAGMGDAWLTSSCPPAAARCGDGRRGAAAAADASTTASAALAGQHECTEDSGTHQKLLALLRGQAAPARALILS